ncbi:MAG TPA: helix-turn-helix domain-containing protein [Pseudonocardiaceae bacterium]
MEMATEVYANQGTATRATIQAVALELFATNGYERTSLRQIAERVGLTKASLYYHYPSKQELLLALVQPLIDQWRAAATYAESLPHSQANVRDVLGRCLDDVLDNRPAAALFVRDAAAVVAAIAPIWEELIDLNRRLHTWLAGTRPTTTDTIRSIAAMEVLGAAISSSAYLPDVAEDELRDTLLDAATAVLGWGTAPR